MNIEKAFDLFASGENFINWIKILLYKQESCVQNGGFTLKYFNLKKGARQGDLITALLFILALEILVLLIKKDSSVKGINVFDYAFSYSTCRWFNVFP